jgi:hypothetical protein
MRQVELRTGKDRIIVRYMSGKEGKLLRELINMHREGLITVVQVEAAIRQAVTLAIEDQNELA